MIETFKKTLDQVGLCTKEKITADGRLHRFHIEGDSLASKNGWYVLYGDGIPAGSFGSWKTGDNGTWCEKAARDLTPTERGKILPTAGCSPESPRRGRTGAAQGGKR